MKALTTAIESNVFLKSALRQLRNVMMVLLVGVAAFGFVLRAVEYAIVTDAIERARVNFRSIGFFQVQHDGINLPYFRAEAEFVGQSPLVAVNDIRKLVQGILPEGMINGNFHSGVGYWLPDGTFEMPLGYQTFFYGTLVQISDTGRTVAMQVEVDYVVLGVPERIQAGQTIPLSFTRAHGTEHLTHIEVGQRYFFRAAFDSPIMRNGEISLFPQIGVAQRHNLLAIDGEDLFYIPVPLGQTVDLSLPHLAVVLSDMELLAMQWSAMRVEGTREAGAMPLFQPTVNHYHLLEGRFIDYDDHIHARPVTMLTNRFAQYNGLAVGDMLTIDLRDRLLEYIWPNERELWRDFDTYYGLTLEIVGIFDRVQLPPNRSTFETARMMVPYSILPAYFVGNPDVFWISGYNFVLHSPGDQAAFIAEYRDVLAAMGQTLLFVDNNAESFAASIYPLLQASLINLALFTTMTAVILAIAAFLYLRQVRRNFAIARAMGVPSRRLMRQLITPILLFWVPSVALIGAAAWGLAHNMAEETLTGLAEFHIDAAVRLPGYYLAGMLGAVALIILIALFAGGLAATRKPVLELLQETTGTKRR